jgi:GNAT superfamily N-acetyltransferase
MNQYGDEVENVEVTRTFLQMMGPEELNLALLYDEHVRVDCAQHCPPSFYRYLYREVGRYYHWVDRRDWSDEEISEYLRDEDLSLWVMYYKGAPGGYFELLKYEDGSTEIAYFGLLPELIGRGLGKHLLSIAVSEAWATGANRVWLQTCSLDDPAAITNYLKRGFKVFNQETYFTTISAEERLTGRWRRTAAPIADLTCS